MITIDANLLIYAYHAAAPQHDDARRWLESTIGGGEAVRLAWSTIHSFLRITTHSHIFPRPISISDASAIVDEWFDQPSVALLEPGDRYWTIFRQFLTSGQARGNLVMDAHLAALALENGAILCTTDKDFTRFENVRLHNPLTD